MIVIDSDTTDPLTVFQNEKILRDKLDIEKERYELKKCAKIIHDTINFNKMKGTKNGHD
jgi:hypothetical protein